MLRHRGEPAGRMNRAALAWLAIVVPVWTVLALCTYWEPIMRDGWGHHIWHLNNDLSLGGLWNYLYGSYVHNNPRLGQTFTLIQHTPGVLHPLVTPLLELALFYLLAVLVLGRRPSLRRTDDALLFATIIAMVFACGRSLGPMLFYRPFTGNYVFGLVVNLAWLVPYRLHAAQARRWRIWWWPIMALLGLASGLCNEHTGPALLAAAVFALVIFWRRGERVVPWAWLGILGMVAGAALLYFAPGQEIRYSGLATQMSTLERIADRGATGNARIFLLYAIYCLPLLLWLVPAIVARVQKASTPQPRTLVVAQLAALATAMLIVATLLASPKQGDRLYFASLCLTAAAAASWVVGQVAGTAARRQRIVVAAITALAIAYVGYRLVSAYHVAGREFQARMATIRSAPKGAPVTVRPYSQVRTRYVLGDDFEVPFLRQRVGTLFGVGPIELSKPVGPEPPGEEP
jgi:hypothetical protein